LSLTFILLVNFVPNVSNMLIVELLCLAETHWISPKVVKILLEQQDTVENDKDRRR